MIEDDDCANAVVPANVDTALAWVSCSATSVFRSHAVVITIGAVGSCADEGVAASARHTSVRKPQNNRRCDDGFTQSWGTQKQRVFLSLKVTCSDASSDLAVGAW